MARSCITADLSNMNAMSFKVTHARVWEAKRKAHFAYLK